MPKRFGYGPEILMLRAPEPLPLTWTIRGGVCPRSVPSADGELLRTILIPGTLLGVSKPALFALTVRLKRGASAGGSCFGGEDGTGASAKSACVTFENFNAGGGSSSESLSSKSKRFGAGALDVKAG